MSEPDLSAKLERALVALMGAHTLDDDASRAEVGKRALRRWLQQDTFQAAVDVDLLVGLRPIMGL